MYKRLLVADGFGRRDLIFAQASFYAGARGVLKVLGYLLEHGNDDEVRKLIEHQARQIKALQGHTPRKRRH